METWKKSATVKKKLKDKIELRYIRENPVKPSSYQVVSIKFSKTQLIPSNSNKIQWNKNKLTPVKLDKTV